MSAVTETPARQDFDVLSWRYEELERAGYPPDVAVHIAERPDIDLHIACRLLLQGATLEQAIRILL